MERSSRPSGVIPAGTRNELTRNVLTIASLIIATFSMDPTLRADVVTSCDGTSLQQAVDRGGLVTIACSGTITLTKTILVSINTTVSGTGHTISGGFTTSLFFVPDGVTLNLDHLNLVHGFASLEGGAILNKGALNVAHCTFLNNSAEDRGGAISNYGTLAVGNTLFQHNFALFGGALHNNNKAQVNSSTFEENANILRATSVPMGGGAIFNAAGDLILSAVTLTGNSTGSDEQFGGGAILNQGDLLIRDSTVSNNNGGCNRIFGDSGSTCSHGGAVSNVAGDLEVDRSTFLNNNALGDSAIYNTALCGRERCVLSFLLVQNSTFFGNYAGISDAPVSLAIRSFVFQSTFSQNQFGYRSMPSGPGTMAASFQASIFAASRGANCVSAGAYTAIPSDAGFNLDDGGTCHLNRPTSFSMRSADLLPIGDNGGPTQTVAPRLDSPVIDAIVTFNGSCIYPNRIDQRGVPRPQGFLCDIGAVEVGPSVPPSSSSCSGYFTGHFIGDLLVNGNCAFVGGSISGNVRVVSGKLILSYTTVGGNIEATGGSVAIGASTVIKGNVEIHNLDSSSTGNKICGANIHGNLAFHNNAAGISIGANPLTACAGNTLDANLEIHDNSAAIEALDNTILRNLDVHNNSAQVQVVGNTVGGQLMCHTNSSVIGGPNPGSGNVQGQCYQAPLFRDFGN